jgi:hypothetical protein
VQDVERVAVHAKAPGLEVTVYETITKPPEETGDAHETNDEPDVPDVAVTDLGALGTPRGTPLDDGRDATDVPTALVATTVNE